MFTLTVEILKLHFTTRRPFLTIGLFSCKKPQSNCKGRYEHVLWSIEYFDIGNAFTNVVKIHKGIFEIKP